MYGGRIIISWELDDFVVWVFVEVFEDGFDISGGMFMWCVFDFVFVIVEVDGFGVVGCMGWLWLWL